MAPPASQLSRLLTDLLFWLKATEIHPLIASSVFHYEFEFIHPFADGNGRMGRLWQTLILSQWRSELAWLPVETLIHYQQARYYQILGQCDKASDCTLFIEFMLENMLEALREGLAHQTVVAEENQVTLSDREHKLWLLLKANSILTTAEIAQQFAISPRTVERDIRSLQQKKRLHRVGPTKGGRWQAE